MFFEEEARWADTAGKQRAAPPVFRNGGCARRFPSESPSM
jgi:hypothetical protein